MTYPMPEARNAERLSSPKQDSILVLMAEKSSYHIERLENLASRLRGKRDNLFGPRPEKTRGEDATLKAAAPPTLERLACQAEYVTGLINEIGDIVSDFERL